MAQRADVLTLVTALQEQEFNVFLFDFSGHGTSPGVTTLGYRETAELRAAVQTIATRDDVDPKRFGLWGVDMGGYAALEVACPTRGSRRLSSTMLMPIRATWCNQVQALRPDGASVCQQVLRHRISPASIINFATQPPVTAHLVRTQGNSRSCSSSRTIIRRWRRIR